jgi:predicted nucleic acid-binding protein
MKNSKIKRVYVDTSVVGGVFEREFQQRTEPLWNAVRNGTIIAIISDILADELENAPAHVQDFFARLPENHIERVTATADSNTLADQYIAAGVVGKTSRDDCRHIALATLVGADVLVSWNFKHIVNMQRIHGYNGVNLLQGYQTIEIRTPNEVIYDEI